MQILGLEQLDKWCLSLLSDCSSRQIVLLSGELGAGKTRLVQSFVQCLGGDTTASPTFSVINEYSTESITVYHVDLYRLETPEALESVGFWDLFEKESGIIFIEWPERLQESELPLDWDKMKIRIDLVEDPSLRKYTLLQL